MSPNAAIVSAACLVAVLTLSGCAQVQEALAPEPEVVTVEATVAVPAAPLVGQPGVEVPDDVPLWPQAQVVSGESIEGESFTLVLRTGEVYDDVVSGVGVGFERAGWQIAKAAEETSLTVITVTNDAYEGLVTVTSDENGTSIEYLLAPTQ